MSDIKVSMMQPSFLPWQGLFELIFNSDKFIFLDDFQFSVQSHHTRNKLFVNKGQVDFYSVPVQKSKCFQLNLNQVLPVQNRNWQEKLLRTLEYNYKKAPFFNDIFGRISLIINQEYPSLAELNMALIKEFCLILGIKCEFLYSSDYTKESHSDATRTKRVLELLNWSQATEYLCAFGSFDYMKEDEFDYKNNHVVFQNYKPKPYKQIHSEKFVPYLSVLDALFNVGPDVTLFLIKNGTEKWLDWDERDKLSIVNKGDNNDK